MEQSSSFSSSRSERAGLKNLFIWKHTHTQNEKEYPHRNFLYVLSSRKLLLASELAKNIDVHILL